MRIVTWEINQCKERYKVINGYLGAVLKGRFKIAFQREQLGLVGKHCWSIIVERHQRVESGGFRRQSTRDESSHEVGPGVWCFEFLQMGDLF